MKFSLILTFVLCFSGSLFSETKNDFYIGEFVADIEKSTELFKKYLKGKGIEIPEDKLERYRLITSKRKFTISASEIIIENSRHIEHFGYTILQKNKDSVVFKMHFIKRIDHESGSISTKSTYVNQFFKFKVTFSDDKKSSITHEYEDSKDHYVYKRK